MIEINELSKFYTESGVLSLDKVTLDIPEKSIVGLIGTNGAGKSTLLRIAAGIYRQDSGTVLVDGEPVYENNDAKSKIAYISDEQFYQPGMTMKRMATIHAALREDFSIKKFYRLAERFGLDVNRRLSGFSKGMRRQSDIAIALSYGAKYLLCDETFDGLDPLTREKTKRIFIEEIMDNGATILMSSHNLREMEDICDRIVLIHKGQLVISANVDDMRGQVSKYQVVFSGTNISVASLKPIRLNVSGRMLSFIAEGDPEEMERKLAEIAQGAGSTLVYCEAVPLTLEEIFSYKLESSGLVESDEKTNGEVI